MEKINHQELLRSIKQCQERSQKTLASIDNTLGGVRETLKDIKKTNDNIDRIKEQYNVVMQKLAEKIAKTFISPQQPFKKKEGVKYQNLPSQIAQQQLVTKMLRHDKILILTGAGVSVDSGIPTFRGTGGLYTNGFTYKGKKYQPQEFLTYQNFKNDPQGIYNWINEIHNMAIQAKYNQTHKQIHLLAKNLAKRGIKVVLATQNIDDLHIKPQNNQYQYYNIHGNCKYMRCQEHHFTQYSPQKTKQKCKICGKDLRPHILFFDECYGKNYGQQIKDQTFSLVICIGSSVKTGLAINMIQRASQIVQINPQPVIQIGKIYTFKNKATDVLKNINQALNKKK